MLFRYALFSLCLYGVTAHAEQVASPDGELVIEVEMRNNHPAYSVTWRGEPLIEKSPVGLTSPLVATGAWRIEQSTTKTIRESWSPIVGKRKQVENHGNELTLKLARDKGNPSRLEVIVRAYNEGLALRSRLPTEQQTSDAKVVVEESTSFHFAGDPKLWSYVKERSPAGPVKLSEVKGELATPVLVQLESGAFAAVHEADLRDAAWLQLIRSHRGLSTSGGANHAGLGWQTPWRVVLVGESLGELVDSDLVALLNPKADPEEFAWVKPGVALWDWRSWGYVAPDGFKFGLNLQSWKRFIDFAAEHEIPYVLLDANWYGPEMEASSDPFTGGLTADVQKAIDYGKERNVGLLLYLNDVAGRKYGVEKILKEWSSWGAAGIKYGFMRSQSPEEKVEWTRRIVRACAENHLLVNFHDGPIPPAGCEATYPNRATREFCHAQSDALRAFTPTTFLMQMAVNQLAGPIDMNNGMFDLNKSVSERPRVFVEVPATITAEAARTLIVYSGLTVIPDATPVYARHPELFRFISAQKMPWTESRTLAFELGQYITVMRQSSGSAGDSYLVGSATNEKSRTIQIPLDFLPQGKKFQALVCEDASDAHYETNREAYDTRMLVVDSKTVIEAKLAPGGGHCLLITPAE